MEFSQLFTSLAIMVYVKGTSELNAFRDTSTCTCTGTIKTYQCTVFGSGATIWNGTALMCPSSANEIRLLHSQFQDGITTECDGGNIVGRSIATQNRSYTSQLSISVTSQINGQSVHCIHDALHRTIIGSASIRISEAPLPPPNDIHLVEVSPAQLTFNWSAVMFDCPNVHYRIMTSNCGQCPDSTTHTTISCIGVPTVTGGHNLCSFSLQTVLCNNILGTISKQLSVALRGTVFQVKCACMLWSPEGSELGGGSLCIDAPSVSAIPIYSHETESLCQLLVTFGKVEEFNVSDGIDGSATSYTITFSDSSSGSRCFVKIILAMNCNGKICEYLFDILSSHCSSSNGITVNVLASNIFGDGPVSSPVSIQGTKNFFVKVSFNIAMSRIICSFINQSERGNTIKTCNVVYGYSQENCTSMSLGGFSDSNIVVIGIPLSTEQSAQQRSSCFTVTASNGTFTAKVEGNFIRACNPAHLLSTNSNSSTLNRDLIAFCSPPLLATGIDGGILCYNGVSIGSIAIYYCSSCSLSLLPVNHVSVRTCTENGSWNGTIPKCTCSDFSDTSQSFTFKISLGISIGTMGVILLIVIFILTSLLVFVLKAKLKVQHQLSLAAQNPVYEELESQIVNPPAASISIEKNSAYIKTSSVA